MLSRRTTAAAPRSAWSGRGPTSSGQTGTSSSCRRWRAARWLSTRARRVHVPVRRACTVSSGTLLARAQPASRPRARGWASLPAVVARRPKQPQAGRPRRRLVRVEQHDGVASVAQGVVERFPPAARRLPPDQQVRRVIRCRGPLLPPTDQLSIAVGRRRDRRALEAHGAAGRFQRADDMRRLGDVDAHDVADLGRQQVILLLTRLTVRCGRLGQPGSYLASRARSPSPWALTGLRLQVRCGAAHPGRRRSTIDRSLTRGRHGSLSKSVMPKGETTTVSCQLSG